MDMRFLRNEMLIGSSGQQVLKNANIIVFGTGGVGSSAAESLARSGIGKLTLVDSDTVDITNINRQLLAVDGAVGKDKTAVQAQRLLSINPALSVTEKKMFYTPKMQTKLTCRSTIIL